MIFIIDVDGVMTTGQFLYSNQGKEYKIFGPDDNDALQLLKEHISIQFISADHRSFDITRKRIEIDMGFSVELVSSRERLGWMENNYPLNEIIYMGDGMLDSLIFPRIFENGLKGKTKIFFEL